MLEHRRRLGLAAGALAIHLAVATRYDFFRDELYFIICGRHPSFGYVDQPPLVPLLSAASQVFGEHLFLLRALSALAAAGTVWATMALARLVGASRFGETLAGIAAAIAPMYLGLMTVVSTASFEPLFWTAIAYWVARALIANEPRAWLWAGLIAGIDLESKYEVPIYLVALLVGVIVTGQARALWKKQVGLAALLAVGLAAPSVVWQLTHGLPFLELIRNQAAEGKNVVLSPVAFVAQQIAVMSPLLAPIWLAGVAAPFFAARLKPARLLSAAFLIAFALLLVSHGKDYYVAPLYGAMFAVGGTAVEGWVQRGWVRGLYVGACVALSAVAAPMAMPILSEQGLADYMARLHLTPTASETLRQGTLPQTFSDMHGWRELTASVTEAVRMLPPEEQRRVVILAHNYGEAGALEFYGRDLPPVICGHNQYALWGLRGLHPDEVISINREVSEVKDHCAEARELVRFHAAWTMPFESNSPLTLCRGVHPSLDEMWPKIRFYY